MAQTRHSPYQSPCSLNFAPRPSQAPPGDRFKCPTSLQTARRFHPYQTAAALGTVGCPPPASLAPLPQLVTLQRALQLSTLMDYKSLLSRSECFHRPVRPLFQPATGCFGPAHRPEAHRMVRSHFNTFPAPLPTAPPPVAHLDRTWAPQMARSGEQSLEQSFAGAGCNGPKQK